MKFCTPLRRMREIRFVILAAAFLVTASPAFAATFIPGDANNDRRVTITDLATLSSNYGKTSGATQADGDFNADGKVTISDLALLSSNYGKTTQPVFVSSVTPGDTIDFGDVPLNQSATFLLTISNLTTQVHAGLEGLSDLTLLEASFAGLTPGFFSVEGFTQGMRIAPGESAELTLRVTPTAVVDSVEATFTLLTDQSAGLGVAGDAFSYNLIDDVIPQPAIAPTPTAAFGGLALLTLTTLRRRKSTRR